MKRSIGGETTLLRIKTIQPLTPIDEVHRRIGRNLLRFQGIEVGLKVILPALEPYCQKNIEGQTLGSLLKQFDESIEASPDFFNLKLEDLRQARNSLVHHFYQLPNVDLLHPEGIKQAIVYLDRQYADSEEWAQVIGTLTEVVLSLRMKADPAPRAQYASHWKLLAQLHPSG